MPEDPPPHDGGAPAVGQPRASDAGGLVEYGLLAREQAELRRRTEHELAWAWWTTFVSPSRTTQPNSS